MREPHNEREAFTAVDPRDSKLASDFAELQGEENRRIDRKVNGFFLGFCAALIGYAVGLALGYW
jgi:hypothetical protein